MQARRIGRFTLVRQVDADARSLLFEATDDSGRSMALRAFSPCLDARGQLPSGTAFEDVGALCAMIRHPALCHVVEHGTDATFGPWFARPWIDGTPLDSAPKLPTASAAQVLRGLAQALSVVHGFGIAHGQVNARHVVLPRGEPGHACLLDLGVALIATRQDATVSATKIAYDQPGLGLDPASDLAGLQRLAQQICAEPEPALLQAFEAAQVSSNPFETLDRQLSTIRPPARAPRPRGHSVLVEDLSVPATMPHGRHLQGEPSALDGLTDGDGFEARYQLAGEIARGGMGAIVKAKDKRLGRDLVVKVLVDAEQAPQGLVHRFVREAQIQGQLEHPNICPVHELGVDASGQPYFVMKWVKGRALSELITAGEPLERLLEVFMKVCDGVAFAHSRGVIHRDLKPDNIMVGEFSEVQVMDWGIAKALGDDSESTHLGFGPSPTQPVLTMAGQAMGTPHFMPPEQARGDTDIDTRADIYALGAILYQILSGQRPVQGRSLPEILLAVLHNKIEAPSQRAPDSGVPADLESACMKALAGDREQRYETVLELKAEVSAFVDGRTLVAAQYTAAERMAKWYGRNRTFARMALLAVSIAIVGAGALAFQRTQAQAQAKAQTAVLAERQLGEAQQLMSSGQWLRAQDSFVSAKKGFEALGQDTGRADFGLWQSRARVPPTALAHTNTGTISALRFLHDQRYITSSGHHVHIRDVLTGEVLHRLTTGGPLIEMTRVSPDGRRIAVRVKGNGFVIWNADTGVRLRGVPARNVADFRLLSSERVAYLTKSGTLNIVELSNPGVALMSASTAANQTLRASEDGRLLIAGANSHIAVFSSIDLHRIARQVTAVYTEDFAPRPDGGSLVLGTLTGAILNMQVNLHPERWMPGLEGPLHREHRHRITQVEVSRSGAVVLTRDESGRTLIRAADSLEPTRELAADAQSIVRLAPSGDFAAIHTDGVTRFVSTHHDPTRRSVASAAEGFSGTQVRFVGDGEVIGVLSNVGLQFMWSGTLETFGFFDGSPVPNPGYGALLGRVSTRTHSLDDHGNHLLTRDDGRLFLQDILTPRDTVLLPSFSGEITGQALAPGARHAVIETSSSAGPRVITIATASVSGPLPGTMLLAPTFSADGSLTVLGAAQPAAGSHKRGVIVWSLTEGAEVLRVAGHDKFVRAADFSPNGDRLFTAGHDGRLLEVEMSSGRVHRQLLKAEVPLSHVVVSHDAQWLAASTDGGELHLIRLKSGEKVGTIKAADRTLRSLTFSPKDERLMLLDRTSQLTILDLAMQPDASATPAALLRSGLSDLGCALAAREDPQATLRDPVTMLSCGAQWGDLGRQRALIDQAQRSDALPVAFAQVLYQSLPKAGADVDLLGRTPLHWAAFQGDLDKVRQLLSEGADPLAHRSDGQTPVCSAVLGGSQAVVSALIEAGADLYDPKAPALDAAIYVGDVEMVKFLLDLGYDPRRSASPIKHAVGTAALVGDEALTKLLLQRTAVGGAELSALLVMVMHAGGPSNIVEALLSAGAPVDDGVSLGDPPLLVAVKSRNHALTRLLVDAGAKLEPTNRQGELPLHVAVKNGDTTIVSTLLGAGANPNRRSGTGQAPLVLAIQQGHGEIVQALITAGAQPDLKDGYGRAPTHTALLAGQTTLMVKLLDAGASMRTKNGRGMSLLREAVRVANLEAVQALVARGAPDRPGPDGATALSEAQRLHRPAMVRALQHAQK